VTIDPATRTVSHACLKLPVSDRFREPRCIQHANTARSRVCPYRLFQSPGLAVATKRPKVRVLRAPIHRLPAFGPLTSTRETNVHDADGEMKSGVSTRPPAALWRLSIVGRMAPRPTFTCVSRYASRHGSLTVADAEHHVSTVDSGKRSPEVTSDVEGRVGTPFYDLRGWNPLRDHIQYSGAFPLGRGARDHSSPENGFTRYFSRTDALLLPSSSYPDR
jgi:hypothetical protein